MNSELTDAEIISKLKEQDQQILRLARSVEVLQDQLNLVLHILEKLMKGGKS